MSKILSIYAVIEEKSSDKAIIFGRAQYITGNKESFYWITKIKGDLSGLFNKS